MKRVLTYLWVTGVFPILILILPGTSCKKDSGDDDPGFYGSWIDPDDGTVYKTLQMGDQLWLVENINKGERIDGSIDQKDNGIIEKYCYDDNPVLCEKYGGLYQWEEAMQYSTSESTQGICPAGWHIPSDSEWKILEMLLGMSGQDADTILWRGTDYGLMIQPEGETGFESLRAGNRNFRGGFNEIGNDGYFWTSSMDGDAHAWRRGVSLNEGGIYRSKNLVSFGFSVRCVKY